MRLEDVTTIEQLREFLSGTQAVAFSVIRGKDDGYRWIQQERVKFHYLTLSRHGSRVYARDDENKRYPHPNSSLRRRRETTYAHSSSRHSRTAKIQ